MQHQIAQLTIPAQLHLAQIPPLHAAPLLHPPQMHMHQMRRPLRQIIQDMRRIHHGTGATLGLALQPGEKTAAAQQIQIDGDLVQQQHGPGPQQAHGELDAAALAVGHGVHAPAQVDIEDGDQLVLPARVVLPADRVEQGGHVDVAAHDRVQHPFQPEVGHPFEPFLEGVDAADAHGAGRGEPLAGEEPEQRRLARAVGWIMRRSVAH